ncbi:putative acetate kinase [Entamoeba marina]
MSNVLIFNVGSSSLTYKVFSNNAVVISGKAHRINVTGTGQPFIEHFQNSVRTKVSTDTLTHAQASQLIIEYIITKGIAITYVGHRFVHGGDYFQTSAVITENVLQQLKECLPLAPIHNPASYSVIEKSFGLLPNTKQYVAIDTAFHSTLSRPVRTYAIPQPFQDKFLKFGFHGLSYEFVINSLRNVVNVDEKKIVACHLGTGGSSSCAVLNGKSIDTSMGNSTLAGLVMSTRSGDIDPSIPIEMIKEIGVDKTIEILNKKSGLLGVSEVSSDMRDILHEIEINGKKRETCQLAFDVYVNQLCKVIGGLIVELGGLDVLVFTDQAGLEVWQLRKAVCDKLKFLDVILDDEINKKCMGNAIEFINKKESNVLVCVAPNDEELVILNKGKNLFGF